MSGAKASAFMGEGHTGTRRMQPYAVKSDYDWMNAEDAEEALDDMSKNHEFIQAIKRDVARGKFKPKKILKRLSASRPKLLKKAS